MLIGERLIVKRFDRWLDHSVSIIVSHWDEGLEAYVDQQITEKDFLFKLSADLWLITNTYAIGKTIGVITPR